MIFVVDTNIFSRSLKNLSFEVFYDIWEPWAELMDNGEIISVDEVYSELENYWGNKDKEMDWIKKHKKSYQKITNREGYIVADIYKNNKFREGVKESSLRAGSPEADAFLVAKAKSVEGIVVTAESDQKPNSEKIPNICSAFGVPYMGIDYFYKMLKNLYHGKKQLQDVGICYKLGVLTFYKD